MKNVIGICNLHDDPNLGELTASRPCGAVSFLGRYGLIDFSLSNFSNSQIDRVYVLVKNGILSLRSHIGNGSIWTRNTKRGFIKLLINEAGLFAPKFNTDIANMRLNLPLEETDFKYAVIAPSFMLASMDYNPIVESHIETGADITVVYSHMVDTDEEFINCDRVKYNSKNEIIKFDTNLGRTSEADISIESIIINKDVLKRIMDEANDISQMYNLRDLIKYYVNEKPGTFNVVAYKYEGFVVPVLSMQHYVKHSLNLLNPAIMSQLFCEDWPIYTTTHNTPPALYGATADVRNSFVANGSIIKGKVINSIISRDVVIEEGAVVQNSIIFTKSEIGKDARLEYVLTDKNVKVQTVKKLSGSKEKALYIKQGVKI